ncbi:hypothetical protein [Gelidibacter pelagius]|uniref:Uncharacterized protein n=1 Tax=Gelidibacter pelagius TaxID=2819985 RepID=A0ABS3ST92_9FLAO|nr:hypothetical protein [Gelidibacter pelagius]MBO3098541.1 hypothetical protein [Gelidibacter pelagius]
MIFTACAGYETDPCDVQHVIINGERVPDYIFPVNGGFENGDKYYHQKYGVVIYVNGEWFDASEKVIEDLEIKTKQ